MQRTKSKRVSMTSKKSVNINDQNIEICYNLKRDRANQKEKRKNVRFVFVVYV